MSHISAEVDEHSTILHTTQHRNDFLKEQSKNNEKQILKRTLLKLKKLFSLQDTLVLSATFR